ncbi:membrane protein [Asanoa ishikariensis]|uniref:ABC-2 family transporter protein n=1 Tax=Asanoa ishikariensis TaxID=137265 RepID=A0A1H3R8S0_9ACTN|nr:hypothetical protein [Asanoa ishikariensis]GIF64278.1 membrane protein [Asanoa ishikariensis]SDZ22060.1 hypothetical protein SAMN05421684_3599 [Asanoa ishikariensis]
MGIGLGLAALIGVLVTAFAWPPAKSAPKDVPVAVVGSAQAIVQAEEQVDAALPDALKLRPTTDVETARDLIRAREVYGAIVFEASAPPRVLIASAASPVVAQLLQGIAGRMAQPDGAANGQVEDVVPLSVDDPRGATFTSSALPMVLGGMLVGILMSFLISGLWRRVAGAAVAAVAAGWVVVGVTQVWLGALEGSEWVNAGAVTLAIAAISMTLIGLVATFGPAGIGIGAIIVFLVGNSISGVASAPELLPTGFGALGQMLPAGAAGTLLRSTSYFDSAGAAGPIVVLASWGAAGLLLTALGRRLRPASHRALAG